MLRIVIGLLALAGLGALLVSLFSAAPTAAQGDAAQAGEAGGPDIDGGERTVTPSSMVSVGLGAASVRSLPAKTNAKASRQPAQSVPNVPESPFARHTGWSSSAARPRRSR